MSILIAFEIPEITTLILGAFLSIITGIALFEYKKWRNKQPNHGDTVS